MTIDFMKRVFNIEIKKKESKILTGHDCFEHGLHNLSTKVWQRHMEVRHKND